MGVNMVAVKAHGADTDATAQEEHDRHQGDRSGIHGAFFS